MTNRRTQLHIRIILKCPDPRSLSNPGHYGVSRVLSQGSGISCCPVQAGALILDLWPSRSVDLDLDYSGLYSADTTSDPRSMDADRLITSEPTMDQGSVPYWVATLLNYKHLKSTDPRSDAHDCCRVLHRIRDQSWRGSRYFYHRYLSRFLDRSDP